MSTNEKYVLMLVERIKTTFENWNTRDEVLESEIYQFLHNIKGTAGSIGVESLSELANERILHVNENGDVSFTKEDWTDLLQSFVEWISVEVENKNEKIENLPIISKDNEEGIKLIDSTVESSIYNDERKINKLGLTEVIRNENKNILLIEDDMKFVGSMIDRLEAEQLHVFVATDINKGLEQVYTMRPSFIMLNHDLINGENIETVNLLIQVAKQIVTTIAFVGNEDTEKNRIDAYKMGAHDYIIKPIVMNVFLPYLNNRLQGRQDVQQMITIDELTGTFNRKYMNEMLMKWINKFEVKKRWFTIAIIDLDHFKHVNDTYGHLVGDEVLKELVNVLKKNIRKDDEIFRFGGEEFIILFPETNEQNANEILTNARIQFSKEQFSANDETFYVTFSAGIMQINRHINSKEKLIEYADQALYRSKAEGRNRVTIYDRESSAELVRKLRVMIVDDDALVREILEDGFNEWKPDREVMVIVDSFEDGIEFLNSDWYVPEDEFIILLDGMMPRMDGIEVLECIRKKYPYKNVVVTMLSARADENNIVKALAHGADDYLFKPFSLTELVARIDRLTRRMIF